VTTSLIHDLAAALQPLGMIPRGGFALSEEDERDLAPFTDLAADAGGRTLILVGNAGPAMYRAFFAARSDHPTGPNPLDTWTRSVIGPIAAALGARAVFPFGGPPWLPFQRWARRAEGLQASPLGILIHPEFGLWHAYRAALLFDRPIDLPASAPLGFPCDTCADRPCLTTCPVGAVSLRGYDVDNCARHVAGGQGGACREGGCLARRACPVGRDYAYPEAALAFHMAAFLAGRRAAL